VTADPDPGQGLHLAVPELDHGVGLAAASKIGQLASIYRLDCDRRSFHEGGL
jgi:hypothetical protein